MSKLLASACSVVLLFSVAIPSARAAVPVANTFKISAKVSSLTAGKAYVFTFRLFDAATEGTALFEEEKSYKVPSSKTITHLLGSMNQAQPLRAEDFLQQVWVEVSTGTKFFPRIKLGPAPLAIGSQNADLLDGLHASDFSLDGHTHGGTGSGLDADLFDGQDGTFYRDAGNLSAGTLAVDRYSAYDDLAAEGHLGDAAGDIALNNGALQLTLYAQRAQTADGAATAVTAETADALSPAALEALDLRYGLALPSQDLAVTVDSAGFVGYYTSITIGADGLPIVSYVDITNWDIKVLHCGNASCSSGNTVTTVDSTEDFGFGTSIAIGADGLPVISYYDNTNTDLKVLHCGNLACSSGNIATTVDSAGGVGTDSSVTIGTDGLPIISYRDNLNVRLKVLHCGNTTCTSGNTAIAVDSTGSVGSDSSIAIGADGLPIVSYYDFANHDLKVLHCGNLACSSSNTATTVDSIGYVGEDTSITIGADGLPVVSYYDATNGNLKVLHCGNLACSSGNTATAIVSPEWDGKYTSITIGADRMPFVSFLREGGGDLLLLHCGNDSCSSGNTIATVDSAGSVGFHTSITIGTDGLPVVSYFDESNDDLKIAHMYFKPLGRR